MIGDVERIEGLGSEVLSSIPCHVLDHEEGSIGNEDHVKRLSEH